MGLSHHLELTTMDAREHVHLMSQRLDQYPNLRLDISWDVIYNAYQHLGRRFYTRFSTSSTRILPSAGFRSSGEKTWEVYAHELEVIEPGLALSG